jgi:pyruvate/2-oxoacid:ferredoxin oxidoreductase alpha subunit
LRAEVTTALRDCEADVSGHVYGLGGRDLHPEDVRDVFAGTASEYVGLRGEPCPA